MTVRELKEKLRLLPDEADTLEVAVTWDRVYLTIDALEPDFEDWRLYLHEGNDRGKV